MATTSTTSHIERRDNPREKEDAILLEFTREIIDIAARLRGELDADDCAGNTGLKDLSCASSQLFFLFQTDVFQASFIVQDSLAI